MRSWLFQDHRQKEKLGVKAPWSVGWYDPEGRKKSKRVGARASAEKFARRIEGQMAAGTYQSCSPKSWTDFVAQYDAHHQAVETPYTGAVSKGAEELRTAGSTS